MRTALFLLVLSRFHACLRSPRSTIQLLYIHPTSLYSSRERLIYTNKVRAKIKRLETFGVCVNLVEEGTRDDESLRGDTVKE